MSARIYYNDNDAFVCAWLRELIKDGHLPEGEIDQRSILDVNADDLREFGQCHFFAGIGGWAYALQLAGVPDLRCWTGSCPCQPLSSAGQRKGHADQRHLWPAFYRLIAECKPATIFGEQVASKDGREWLAGVRADLAQLGYAIGAADLAAACVAAEHPRQRIFFVADAGGAGLARSFRDRRGICGGPETAPAEHGNAGLRARIRFEPDPGTVVRIDGLPRPVGQVRAIGNSIVPQVAAEFIKAAREAVSAA